MIRKSSQSGNVLFFVLIAIVLLGVLTVAIRGGGDSNTKVDKEKLSLVVNKIMSYVAQVDGGIRRLLDHNQLSESELLFGHASAHADYGTITAGTEQRQLFDYDGGNVVYQLPPEGINDGTSWEFIGGTHAPGVGSDRADLLLVLPNVTVDFCEAMNKSIGYAAGVIPTDSAACFYATADRFDLSDQFDDASPNTMDEASFTLPAMRACVECSGSYHFYSVIMDR